MFGFKKKTKVRQLNHVNQLMVGDIVTFKDRPPLPLDLQGQDFQVTQVGGYQYDDYNQNDFRLMSTDYKVINLCFDDGESTLCISRKIERSDVLNLFNEDDFAELWGEGFVDLQVQKVPDELQGWVDASYHQTIKEGTAFYYSRDIRDNPPSSYENEEEDDSTELRYHECESESGDFELGVEIYEDGETEISLVMYLPLDVIADLHPGDDLDQ